MTGKQEEAPVREQLASALEDLAAWFRRDEVPGAMTPADLLVGGCVNDVKASLNRARSALDLDESNPEQWAVVFTDVEAENGELQRKALVRLYDTQTAALDDGVELVRENGTFSDWDALDAEATRKVLIENGTYCEAEWVVAVVEVDQ